MPFCIKQNVTSDILKFKPLREFFIEMDIKKSPDLHLPSN